MVVAEDDIEATEWGWGGVVRHINPTSVITTTESLPVPYLLYTTTIMI
jgi:hypothetical protein